MSANITPLSKEHITHRGGDDTKEHKLDMMDRGSPMVKLQEASKSSYLGHSALGEGQGRHSILVASRKRQNSPYRVEPGRESNIKS